MATHAVRGAEDHGFTRQLLIAVRTHQSLLDAGLASLLVVVILLQATTGAHNQPAAGTVALLVGAVAIAWRRRWPVATAAVAIAAYLINHLVTRYTGPGQPAVLIGLYTVAANRERRLAVGVMGAAVAAVLVGQGAHDPLRLSAVMVSLIPIVAASLLGLLVAERRSEQERERQLLADNAAADERVRIARELHDVVAHHLSVIVVQANVVAEAMPAAGPTEPAQAIIESGRRALDEMRRILGVLRSVDLQGDRTAPAPGLSQVGALIDTFNHAGIRVEVAIEGEERRLPESLDQSAYRIVQEALTNVLRHARATRATVRIRYGRDELELRITDDGVGVSGTSACGSGHGLVGMRERAAAFGGRFDAGPAEGRGYQVRAVLPL